MITRHTHPKARPETSEPSPAPSTGIAYLQLVAETHHAQVRDDERIGFHALYSTAPDPRSAPPEQIPGQIPGQLSIDDLLDSASTHEQGQEVGR